VKIKSYRCDIDTISISHRYDINYVSIPYRYHIAMLFIWYPSLIDIVSKSIISGHATIAWVGLYAFRKEGNGQSIKFW